MTAKNEYVNPLADIDPIMQNAFSDEDFDATVATEEVEEEDASIARVEFPSLENTPTNNQLESDIFKNIPVNVSVELGRSQVSLKEIYELTEGSIIELERLVGEPLDLVVNGQVVARGEVVAIDNNYGLRVTEVVSKSDLA